MEANEAVSEGNFRDEASLPIDAESVEIMPGQIVSQQLTAQSEFILRPCTDEYSESSPVNIFNLS